MSARTQAAAAGALVAPLLHLLHGLQPTPAQLQGIAAALHAEVPGSLGDKELADGLWGLAMLGAGTLLAGGSSGGAQQPLPQQQQQQQHVASLVAAAVDRLAQMPAYEAIVTGAGAVWCVCGVCVCVCVLCGAWMHAWWWVLLRP
jgi:hypothetical protein